MKIRFPLLILLISLSSPVFAAEKLDLSKVDVSKLPPAADKKGLTYAKDIRPMLESSCLRCHGQNRPKAGLQLDSLEGLLRGSHDGKVVVPGDSKKSLLVIAAARIDEETAMPPKRGPGRGPGGRRSGGPGGGSGQPGGGGQGQPPPPGASGGQGDGHPGQGAGSGGQGGFGPPPKPLSLEQVSLLRAWVDQGAK